MESFTVSGRDARMASVRKTASQRILNVCGTCTECCRVLAVEELSKGELTVCKHEHNHSCSIYKHRPASCKGYTCVYHTWMTEGEKVPLMLRPDKSKVIIDYMPHLRMHFVRVDQLNRNAWQKVPVINTIVSMLMQPNVTMILMVDGTPSGKFNTDEFKKMVISPITSAEKVILDKSQKI